MKNNIITTAVTITLATTLITISGCATNTGYHSTYKTDNENAKKISRVIPSYLNMTSQSWAYLQINQPIHPYDSNASIIDIRKKLIILGDLNQSFFQYNDLTYYDSSLFKAVKRFQWRHGLNADGIIDNKTIKALNVSPSEKVNILIASRDKWSQFSDKNNANYILVNIPDFNLNVMQSGRSVFTSKVIIGTTYNQTPEVNSEITTMVFNPTWNVPKSIISKEFAPTMMKDSSYLANNNISIYGGNAEIISPDSIDWMKVQEYGTDLRFTQSAGSHNVLGKVKFLFYNPHDIYLHDTTTKSLFAKQQRSFSHGCVRVEKPMELAQYLLSHSGLNDINPYYETEYKSATRYIKLKNPIPLHVAYITSWVDNQGYTHFRNNIYKYPMQ